MSGRRKRETRGRARRRGWWVLRLNARDESGRLQPRRRLAWFGSRGDAFRYRDRRGKREELLVRRGTAA